MSERRHIWRAFVVYKLDDEDAAKFYAGPPGPVLNARRGEIDPTRVTLTAEMIDQGMSNVGCLTCEQPWMVCRHKPCPGEPVDYKSNGEPIYAR
jgi:hypothetical protein